MSFSIREHDGAVSFKVHVSPRSSKNSVCGFHSDSLSVKITAPALEGRANQALCEFIADFFSVKKKQVEIISGDKSREKTVKITGIDIAYVNSVIEKCS